MNRIEDEDEDENEDDSNDSCAARVVFRVECGTLSG
jgi:hypothetical protein